MLPAAMHMTAIVLLAVAMRLAAISATLGRRDQDVILRYDSTMIDDWTCLICSEPNLFAICFQYGIQASTRDCLMLHKLNAELRVIFVEDKAENEQNHVEQALKRPIHI